MNQKEKWKRKEFIECVDRKKKEKRNRGRNFKKTSKKKEIVKLEGENEADAVCEERKKEWKRIRNKDKRKRNDSDES